MSEQFDVAIERELKSIENDIKKSGLTESSSLLKDFTEFAEDEVERLDDFDLEKSTPKVIYSGQKDRDAIVITDDYYGDTANRVIYLDQGWDAGQSLEFYYTSQGSELMSYDQFVSLEQKDNERLFIDPLNISKYRYLPQSASDKNPDALPVGFVKNSNFIGLTCAACHTSQVNYQGTAIRIDGGPTMGNFVAFLKDLADSIRETLREEAKFDRFAKRVMQKKSKKKPDQIKKNLRSSLEDLAGYNRRNYSSTEYGFARIDAVGRIYNQVLYSVDGPENSNPPNAPVSYPFLWDTPQHDYVQWIGLTGNAGPGALGRNAGEVVGVFGKIKVKKFHSSLTKLLTGYTSTVRTETLVDMEKWLRKLKSPLWPEDILPKLDDKKIAAGKILYEKYCLECHHTIDRNNPKRRVYAQMYGLDVVKTDPTEAENATS
ncbi:hypothetical protein VU04_09285, partial [Desulfobulbus sp. TB]|nr:hypothetical protein [Desulfobulbus sp. TB]